MRRLARAPRDQRLRELAVDLATVGDAATEGPWEALAREHLAAGRVLVTKVCGQSMWPLIRDGERVEVRPRSGPVEIGDVVLVMLGHKLVLHRVVAIQSDGVVTKGDAVGWCDPPSRLGEVLGVVDRKGPSRPVLRGGARWVAQVSRLGGEPLAAAIRKLRVALGRRP